jgi:orotate phosphoribosyltransferase
MSARAKPRKASAVVISPNQAALQEELLSLFGARKGHFRFESGHHGDLWLDIPRAYIHPNRLHRYAAELARLLSAHEVEAVCGPLVEGALLAQMVAEEMVVEFYFAEQFSLPHADGLYPVRYRIPKALRAAIRGKRTAVVDDVINAGSAVRGACDDLQKCDAHLVAIGALMVLGTRAAEFAASLGVPLETLSRLANSALWEPASCPLCASGVALEGVGVESQ